MDIDSLLNRLDDHNGRGSLVGSKGSGKTTLLLELADALGQKGFFPHIVRLTSGDRQLDLSLLENMDSQTALLLDGVEQLPWYVWWQVRWLARKIPCFITTSHTRPYLPLLHRHQTSVELLKILVAELHPEPMDVDLDEIYRRNNGNIRNCLRELYDIVGIGDVMGM